MNKNKVFRAVLPKAVEPPPKKRSFLRLFGGVGLGAALMYFLDPRDGRRRRAIARDRIRAMSADFGRRASRKTRYVAGKRHGIVHAVKGQEMTDVPNDVTLQHKIESEVLRNYPKGRINVNVEEGVAVLRGELDRPEQIRSLVEDIERVPGVVDVRSLLHLPGTPPPTYENTSTR